MVSSGLDVGIGTVKPRREVLQLLQASGLMVDLYVSYPATLMRSTDPTGRHTSLDRLTITSKGFQFLLEDRQTQLWQILMFYLTLKEVCIVVIYH